MNSTLKAPFPWFGGKSRVASVVWERFGDVATYTEPFFGSGAVLLNRPHWGPNVKWAETVNDLDGLVANAWRSMQIKPDEVAKWADWPINENDLHARRKWLVGQDLQSRLEADPEFCDPKIAGWWIWAVSCSIRWGDPNRSRPHLSGQQGVMRGVDWQALAGRLKRVRVCSGDWSRILGPSSFGGGAPHGVFLDPPYSDEASRQKDLYVTDSGSVAHDVRDWCVERGDDRNFRIALCGYQGEGHDMLVDLGWSAFNWSSSHPTANRHKEVIWFSPHCREPELSLLDM